MVADGIVPGSIYLYAPNKVAPVIFAVLFLITTLWHFWQCVHFKAWKITGMHVVAAFIFTLGFALREYGAFNYDAKVQSNVTVFIISTCAIYMAPPILELANFHALGRILYYVPYHSPMHPGRTLTTFGSVASLVEILNGVGIAWIANPAVSKKLANIGHIMLKASLIIQVGVIACFCGMAISFHQRCAKGGVLTRATKEPLITMYTSSLLITIRCIYRIIEHFGAKQPKTAEDFEHVHPTLRLEWYFYVFEATMMLINSYLWNARHPRLYLPEDYHVYLAQDGVTEITGPGWKDDRPFLATVLDPFGYWDKSAKKQTPFWENNGFSRVDSTEMPLRKPYGADHA